MSSPRITGQGLLTGLHGSARDARATAMVIFAPDAVRALGQIHGHHVAYRWQHRARPSRGYRRHIRKQKALSNGPVRRS